MQKKTALLRKIITGCNSHCLQPRMGVDRSLSESPTSRNRATGHIRRKNSTARVILTGNRMQPRTKVRIFRTVPSFTSWTNGWVAWRLEEEPPCRCMTMFLKTSKSLSPAEVNGATASLGPTSPLMSVRSDFNCSLSAALCCSPRRETEFKGVSGEKAS